MSILILAFLLQGDAGQSVADGLPPQVSQEATAKPSKDVRICREMLVSSSRLRPVRVCKTRAGWQRWERCHSATRYCAPPTRSTVTVASLPGEKLICKYLKVTGSRIEQQKICATRRQWEIAELEAQEAIRNRQSQSMAPDAGFINPGQATGDPR